MALIHGDGFSYYNVAHLPNKWDYVSSDITGLDLLYGRLGSKGVRGRGGFQTIGQGCLGKNLGMAVSGWGFFGTAVRHDNMQAQGYTVLHAVYDIADSGAMKLCTMLGADGSLAIGYVTVNNFSTIVTVIDSTAPGQFVAGSHVYFESGFKIHNVAGGAIIKVAGAQPGDPNYLEIAGNTRHSEGSNFFPDSVTNRFTHVRLIGGADVIGGGEYLKFCDYYFCDDTDTRTDMTDPRTDTFLGNIRLLRRKPDAQGTTNNFNVTGAATSHEAVDDDAPDDLASYVSSPDVGDRELYGMENAAPAETVYGRLINARVGQDDAAARSYNTLVKPAGGAVSIVATRTTPDDFTNQQDVSEFNPATGKRWTVAQLNAAGSELGFEINS